MKKTRNPLTPEATGAAIAAVPTFTIAEMLFHVNPVSGSILAGIAGLIGWNGIDAVFQGLDACLNYSTPRPQPGKTPIRATFSCFRNCARPATRSKRPFLFVTILHQAIDRYAEHMSGGRGPNGRRCRAGSRTWLSRRAPSSCCGCLHRRSSTRGMKPGLSRCVGRRRCWHRKLARRTFTSAR